MIVRIDKQYFEEPKNGSMSVASKVKLTLEKAFPDEPFIVCQYRELYEREKDSQ